MSRYAVLLLILAALALLVGQPMLSASLSSEPPAPLLINGDFEGAFTTRHDPYTGIWAGELSIAEAWEPWYDNQRVCPPHEPACNPASYNIRPEYNRATQPLRVAEGASAQHYFTTYGTHTAGIYQTVTVPPESWVHLSIQAMSWSSSKDIAEYSFQPGYYGLAVGIDPQGGDDWSSGDIQWSVPITRSDVWIELEVTAYTASGEISVWTRGTQLYPVKHNDSYWDDARLEILAKPPLPSPTATATATPYPTLAPTPDGYEPSTCDHPRLVREDTFATDNSGWASDAGTGHVGVQDGAMWLRNGAIAAYTFPIAWVEERWPERGDVRIATHFSFEHATGYGSSIGLGSVSYAGERSLAGSPDVYGIDDILRVRQHSSAPGVGDFAVRLLDTTVWQGTPGDERWHELVIELRGRTYIVWVDGVERGRAVSWLRPQSLVMGNPVVVWNKGLWTEVGLDDLRIETCEGLVQVPVVYMAYQPPLPTLPAAPTAPVATPSATLAPTTRPAAAQTPETMHSQRRSDR